MEKGLSNHHVKPNDPTPASIATIKAAKIRSSARNARKMIPATNRTLV